MFDSAILKLVCSCDWIYAAENNDPQGRMLEILKGIHEMRFNGHVCKIEED